MHIALLTNPASGQANVHFATAQELVSQGHRVTFLSAESCGSKVSRFRQCQPLSRQSLVHFISLGSAQIIQDYTKLAQVELSTMQGEPGSIRSLLTGINGAFGPSEIYADVAYKVSATLEELDPDMVCVDCFSSPYIHGTRMAQRKHIVFVPCSPGLTASRGSFIPYPIAGNRKRSWGTLFENAVLQAHEFVHSRTDAKRRAKRRLLLKGFKLKSFGHSEDTWILPPYWKDDNCVAGVHFNTLGLADCPEQPSKLAFVGAGLCPDMSPVSSDPDEDVTWMNQALALQEDVVYMNMGSMFIWREEDFWNCMRAFQYVSEKLQGRVRFLVKINSPMAAVTDASLHFTIPQKDLPACVRLTHWVKNQAAIYSHPALRVFIHHGGGNSFNEAVHFGLPQLVLSQWFDTHEYGYCAEKFGLGFRSRRPPAIERRDVESKLLRMLGTEWPVYKENCMAWAVRSQIGGGAAAAARLVLAHAEQGSRSVSSQSSRKSSMCYLKEERFHEKTLV
ncbi:UDP-glucuronosyl UDP-glucosyltransferase [Cordyceps militaris]|uniref:UDP-glucuronosyl UDP-glucosyltransferase n=1 Tax=Cordyceps militaris TaxID=73501 RepID=A0A2H4SLK5_CORMI|nr:UDP-glucuronosyl UDP-glucosyltransferase [Cordyceps militaris]